MSREYGWQVMRRFMATHLFTYRSFCMASLGHRFGMLFGDAALAGGILIVGK